MQKHGVVVVEN